jgi:hypothetical protein
MKIVYSLVFFILLVPCQSFSQNTEEKINSAIDEWHKAASEADADAFFGFMDLSCIYIGTDAGERWNKNEFIQFAKPYFDKGKAWDFSPYNRNILFSEDGKIAWFDELLETWMGVCRSSGVLELKNDQFKLIHYHLSITVPNEKIYEFIDLINASREGNEK